MFLSQLCAQTSICREMLMGCIWSWNGKWSLQGCSCAGEHPPCPWGLCRCLPEENRHCWHCLLVWHSWGWTQTQGLMHIKSSFPLLPCFEVGSIFFSTLNIPLFQQLKAKRWQQDVAEGEDDFWEVRSCTLGPSCFKSLSRRGLHVWNWEATGHQMCWFWSKQVNGLSC